MKVLVDMNLSPGWVSFLAEAGFEAVHWTEIGSPTATDSELMAWAAKNDHIVLTADLDFGAILAATQDRGQALSRYAENAFRHIKSALPWCKPFVSRARICSTARSSPSM